MALRLGALALLLPLTLTLLAAGSARADAGLLAGWLAGEWNNHEQVWQQRLDFADPKVAQKPPMSEHLHQVAWPLKGSALGTHVFFVQPSAGDDLAKTRAPYLLRLTNESNGAVRVQRLRLRDAAKWTGAQARADTATTLAAVDTAPEPGCEMVLKPNAEKTTWSASASTDECAEARTMSVSAERWTADNISSRKARYYTGWLWFRNAGPGAAADDKDTSFTARFVTHNEGQKTPVLRNDGSATPWAVELAVLTYQNTRRPILKLALIDRATGKSISYTWTDTDGRTLGINLGWFQTGLTVKAENTAFGF